MSSLIDLAATERPDSPRLADAAARALGVYVHLPFCVHKCGYCDFASYSGMDPLMGDYVYALETEIQTSGIGSADTVFVGGGTPTALPPDLLERVLSFVPDPTLEFTVEANPETVDEVKAEILVGAGVTRVSLGMQSADRAVLDYLERLHDASTVSRAVRLLRSAGIDSINVDLIYGSPVESVASWQRTLETALALEPDHVSAYALAVEEGTPLSVRIQRGEASPAEDDQADKMAITADVLEKEGFVRYEVSNWARPGKACVHNLIYWGCGEYFGFGSGAHSHAGGSRWWNPRSPVAYIEAVEADRLPAGREELDDGVADSDRLTLGIRRVAGLDRSELAIPSDRLRALESVSLAAVDGDRVKPTRRGLAMNSELAVRLLALSALEC